jgi:hypothetical protein
LVKFIRNHHKIPIKYHALLSPPTFPVPFQFITPLPQPQAHTDLLSVTVDYFAFYISGRIQDVLFFCLALLTKHSNFEIHSCCYKYQQFSPFHSRVVLHCIALPVCVSTRVNGHVTMKLFVLHNSLCKHTSHFSLVNAWKQNG